MAEPAPDPSGDTPARAEWITRGLVGAHVDLYQTSAGYHQHIDILAATLVQLGDVIADSARRADAEAAQALELMKRQPWPTAAVMASLLDSPPAAGQGPHVDHEELPRLAAIHRALRSAGTQGTTVQMLGQGSALPLDVVRRFLDFLEANGWATSSPHDQDKPHGPRTWWAHDNFRPHPYKGTRPVDCLYEVWGARCGAPASHALHRVTGVT